MSWNDETKVSSAYGNSQDNKPHLQKSPSRIPTGYTYTTHAPSSKTTKHPETTIRTTRFPFYNLSNHFIKTRLPNNPPPTFTMVLHDTKSYLFLLGFLIIICLPLAALCGKRDKVIADKEIDAERAWEDRPLEEWYKPRYSPYTKGARPFRHIEAYARTGETNLLSERRGDRMSLEG